MLIDTHAHLNDARLLPIADEIISGMSNDGLEAIINVSYDRLSSATSVELSQKYPNVWAAVGIHPHDSKNAQKDDYDYFATVSKLEKVVAIGEIGLDYYYENSDKETQLRVLAEQLELADYLKKPIIIHLRDATEDMLRLFRDNAKYINNGGVLHCFSGSKETLKIILDYGLSVSFGGAITFKNYAKQEVIAATPLDRLLLETDCPYLTPVPYRGQINYPKNVKLVAQTMANVLNEDYQTIVDITTKNAKKVFRIDGYNSIQNRK